MECINIRWNGKIEPELAGNDVTKGEVHSMTASPGGMTRAPTDGQLRLITKVARMYHERGVRQTDIAGTLHISQARVSRLLKRAAELGIVRTVVAALYFPKKSSLIWAQFRPWALAARSWWSSLTDQAPELGRWD